MISFQRWFLCIGVVFCVVDQELCTSSLEIVPQLLVDFWEALLVASSQKTIIQELLMHLTSVYTHRIIHRERSGIKALKTAEDLVGSDLRSVLTRAVRK